VSDGAGQVRHPLFARAFARGVDQMDERGAAGHRRRLVAGLAGRVVEIGAGTGANFRHYPSSVSEVLAAEPEPYLRERALAAAAAAALPITVVDAVADRLPLDDASCDAAVASLVLCSVGDQAAALAEIRRVLRPGGELRFYEHVCSTNAGRARAQRALDIVWPRFGGGCHAGRDTLRAISDAGFAVEECDRFSFRPNVLAAATSPHVLGRARSPG
jgi:ubiquinone/menaquinone biosynthesis C-methylase UbiE